MTTAAAAPPSDDGLMLRVRAADELAFGVLQDRYRERVYRFVLGLVRDTHLAQDVTQEVFAAVFAKAHTYLPRSRFRAWLFEIARNQALTALRAQRRAPRPLSCLGANDDDAGVGIDALAFRPDERLPEERELMSALRIAIAGLPEHYQLVFGLCVQRGMSYQDAARQIGAPIGTVAIRLMRARQRLFGALAPHFDHVRRPPACLQSA